MSIQLIVYPQSHDGYSSTFSAAPAVEFIVDGIDFLNINVSDAITNSGTLTDILTTQPPTIVNTWYRARENAAVAYPTQSSGNLILNSVSAGKYQTVIYQRLDNLIVGQIYTVTVNFASTPTSGTGVLAMINGTTIIGIQGGWTFYGSGGTQVTTTFTAETTQDIFLFTWEDNINNNLTIQDISVRSATVIPSGVYTDLQDGQVICDLYQEEDIPLTLSMDEFKDVAGQVKSYSKDFSLPATKRNNRIFNNMFEVTRNDDGLIFNPQVVTKCVLKQDGFILFEGYLKMTDIKDKEGEISYNVHLYSEVVALADVLGDRTFADLDFYELEHTYAISNIKNSWESTGAGNGLLLTNPLPTTSLAYDSVTGVNNTQVLKYPFIDWNHQISLIAGAPPAPTLANLEVGFRPCIQVKYLIDKIFADTEDFTYTSDFFNTTDFKKLFMDFNWGENDDGAVAQYNGYNHRDFDDSVSGDFWLTSGGWKPLPLNVDSSGDSTYWNTVSHRWTSPANNINFQSGYKIEIRNEDPVLPASHWVALRIAHYDQFNNFIEEFGFADQQVNWQYTKEISGVIDTVMNAGDYIRAEFKCPSDNKLNVDDDTYWNMAWHNTASQAYVLLDEIRGELGQWDFLKGIMTMFNLVSTSDKANPSNILIEPYSDMFIKNTKGVSLASRSIEHDWTDKIDISEMELTPLTDLEKDVIFKFVEDDDDYLSNVFTQLWNGHLYGSKLYNASTSSSGLNTLFTGEKEIVAEPFAASVIAPLMSQYLEFVVPRIYARDEDGVCTSFANSPRILYNNGIRTMSTDTYIVLTQNGELAEELDNFLQFSHLSEIPSVSTTTTDFVFDSWQLASTSVGIPPLNNLFTTYWLPYFAELYNADTRTMKLKVNLSPSDVASFKFTDTVMIKNRSFRVNKIEYKPNSLAKVEFILLP